MPTGLCAGQERFDEDFIDDRHLRRRPRRRASSIGRPSRIGNLHRLEEVRSDREEWRTSCPLPVNPGTWIAAGVHRLRHHREVRGAWRSARRGSTRTVRAGCRRSAAWLPAIAGLPRVDAEQQQILAIEADARSSSAWSAFARTGPPRPAAAATPRSASPPASGSSSPSATSRSASAIPRRASASTRSSGRRSSIAAPAPGRTRRPVSSASPIVTASTRQFRSTVEQGRLAAVRHQQRQSADAPVGEQQPEQSAERRQQQRLRQELPDDPHRARRPDSAAPPSRGAARRPARAAGWLGSRKRSSGSARPASSGRTAASSTAAAADPARARRRARRAPAGLALLVGGGDGR